MSDPVFSLVVPAFNAAAYIAEALDSILEQECRWPFEIIVVNDGSTDATGGIVEAYGAPVRQLLQDNGGPASARNAGVRAARSDLILLLDADDRAMADRLERQVGFMLARPEIDICFGNWLVEGATDDYLGRYGVEAPPDAFIEVSDPLTRLLTRGSFVPTSTVAVRRRAYLDSGMQPDGAYYAEDYALWCEIAARGGRFACCGAPLAWYRTTSPFRLTRSVHTYAGLTEVLGRALGRYGDRLSPAARAETFDRFVRAAEILLRHEWAYGGRRKVLKRLATLDPPLPQHLRRKWEIATLVPSIVPRAARAGLHKVRKVRLQNLRESGLFGAGG